MEQKKTRLVPHVILLVVLCILVGHVDLLPDWVYARGIQLSLYDRPFDLVFSLERILLLVLSLVSVSKLYGLQVDCRSISKKILTTFIAILLGTTVLVGPAILTRHVKFEPKLPEITLVWSFHNLVFVCVIEELLFRNYIFEGFNKFFRERKGSMFYPLVISAVLFGLYHFRSGPILAALAAIAGVVYAFAYKRGGLIAAVVSHFGVNLVHFLFFSYPALQRANS